MTVAIGEPAGLTPAPLSCRSRAIASSSGDPAAVVQTIKDSSGERAIASVCW